MGEKVKNAEIAFFGGSFTAIDREYMVSLLSVAHLAVKKYGFMGIRISTRPDKIDHEVLPILKAHSVTSIELGAQSMVNAVLMANDRGHTAEDVKNASGLIKEYGFELGLQMMTGLYKSDYSADLYTAKEIISLKPNTVRIYPTVTLENTTLCDLYKKGEYVPPSLEETVELCSELMEGFEKNGICVIRVGLHAVDEVSSKRVAGPYHPAFRELCISRMLLKKYMNLLSSYPHGEYIIAVNPKLISPSIGQNKSNIKELQKNGYTVKFVADPSIGEQETIIQMKGMS